MVKNNKTITATEGNFMTDKENINNPSVNHYGFELKLKIFTGSLILFVFIAGVFILNGCGGGPGVGTVITGNLIDDKETKNDPPAVKTLASLSLSKTADTVVQGTVYNLALISCTAVYSDGSSKTVGVSWSVTSGGGNISGSNFTAPSGPSTSVLTASYTENSVVKIKTLTLTISGPTPSKTLASINISKTADTVNSAATYNLGAISATATYSDGSTGAITVTWSVASGGGTISGSGYAAPAGPATAVLTASYTEGAITKTQNLTLTVNAPAPVSAVAISEQKVSKTSAGDYKVTWKTAPATAVKAKITVMSSEVPSPADKVMDEILSSASASHEYTVKAADAPGEFYGIKISYLIFDENNEDIGTSKVIQKKDIVSESAPANQPVVISSQAAKKEANGDYTVTWKTDKATGAKARITIMTSEMPNPGDPFVTETQTGSTEHSVTLPASIMPASFAKIKISYIIIDETGEDVGTFKTIDKNNIQ